MGAGSYLRFFVGLLMAVEVLRIMLSGEGASVYLISLSLLYLALASMFFLKYYLIRK